MIVEGVHLPDGEVHFRDTLRALAREGRSALYPALTAALPFVTSRRRALDVGAHVGLWSRWLVGEFDWVNAFEPLPEHAELFRRNVNGSNWTLHELALGAHAGLVGIKPCVGDTGRAHVCVGNEVSLQTLDSYGFADVDLIKIDVEGYELAVVVGGSQTLKRNKPIVVIEQRGCEVTNFGEQRDQALAYLQGIGMRRLKRVGHDWIMGWE
jgi:FkbM family methyltransferase